MFLLAAVSILAWARREEKQISKEVHVPRGTKIKRERGGRETRVGTGRGAKEEGRNADNQKCPKYVAWVGHTANFQTPSLEERSHLPARNKPSPGSGEPSCSPEQNFWQRFMEGEAA